MIETEVVRIPKWMHPSVFRCACVICQIRDALYRVTVKDDGVTIKAPVCGMCRGSEAVLFDRKGATK